MIRKLFPITRENWPDLNTYQRFEQIVAIILGLLVSVVIVFAVWNLSLRIFYLLLNGVIDPSDAKTFQIIFGSIITILIALEFNHTILGILERGRRLIQVQTVVLIALLAVLRKFILIDTSKADPMLLLGLSASALALGGVYWALREQDRDGRRRAAKNMETNQ